MANVDHDDQKPGSEHPVDNAIVAEAVGITAFQLTLERFPLKRVAFKSVECFGKPPVKRRFPLGNLRQNSLSPVGKFKFIAWQGSA